MFCIYIWFYSTQIKRRRKTFQVDMVSEPRRTHSFLASWCDWSDWVPPSRTQSKCYQFLALPLRLHQLYASANCAFVVVSTDLEDDVEVNPRSSPKFVGDDVPISADFPYGGTCVITDVVVLQHRLTRKEPRPNKIHGGIQRPNTISHSPNQLHP